MPPRTRRGLPTELQKRSIRLTVKAPPTRLQEIKGDEDEEEEEEEEDEEEDSRPPRGRSGRASKQKQSYVEKDSEEEDEEDDEEEAGDDEDDEDEEQEDDDEEDDEEDVEMEDAPAAGKPTPSKPTIKISTSNSAKSGKNRKSSPSTHLNLSNTKHRSVEEKETGDAPSQSESSEVEEDPEDLESGALDEPPTTRRIERDRGDTIKVDAINESDLDSEDSNESSLPDLSKLTRRQRGGVEESSLMALSNEAQKKKFFTPEQITMRRAEMARRRKDLSEKRNEQEKADTLRRLLQKPAPTRRSRAQVLADAEREEFGLGRAGLRGESVVGEDGDDGEPEPKANRLYVRTVIGGNGTRVGVPAEWLDTPAGTIFEGSAVKDGREGNQGWSKVVRSGRLVEEVE